MKPTFLFIGPDKTGSTWLYQILRGHPDCHVPDLKDIYFFDRFYSRGLDWYFSLFEDAAPHSGAVGELSHDYLFSAVAAERIAKDLPDVKLLTCLRDPVERTFSHYLYMIRSGRTKDTFETALDRFPELIENSLYAKHLRPYLELFPRDQIKVLFFEKLRADPRGFAAEVFEFLEIPLVEDLPYEERVLPASRPRSMVLARLAKLGAEAARRIGMTSLVGRVKSSPLVVRTLYRPYDRRPKMDSATAEKLRERFRDDIVELQRMLSVDLSRWLGQTEGADR
jgi:hypothetical protein